MTKQSTLFLYYIDTRPLSSSNNDPSHLPLLTTLRHEDQTSITRFLRPPDRHMSLASNLLKYLFIHRTAKIPWSEIIISRTPSPHKRPFWDPSTAPSHGSSVKVLEAAKAVEFNVSHQAGLVVLAGCLTSSPPSNVIITTHGPILANSSPHSSGRTPDPDSTSESGPNQSPRLGIDITSPTEHSRRPNHIDTLAKFSDWVDIFSDVFSAREMQDMKSYYRTPSPPKPHSSPSSASPDSSDGAWEVELVAARLRRFYTFFALKEAYIKMTGEALLAKWLRDLEFRNVTAPGVAEEGKWGEVEVGFEVWFRKERVEGLRIEVVGFGAEFVVALVGKGMGRERQGQGPGQGVLLGEGMREVDIEGDVRACAEGRCGCLDNG